MATAESTTETKYIVLGFVFWAFVLVFVIVLTQLYTPKNTQQQVHTKTSQEKQQWLVKVASFSNNEYLEKMERRLKEHRYQTHLIFSIDTQGRTIKGIRVGPYHSHQGAQKAKQSIDKIFKLETKIIRINSTQQ